MMIHTRKCNLTEKSKEEKQMDKWKKEKKQGLSIC